MGSHANNKLERDNCSHNKKAMSTYTLSRGPYKNLIAIGMLFLFEEAVEDHQRGKHCQEN
jgi:hypothetical protein